ncbi:squamosa promoter binding protein-like 14 [Euphorbia peplus]|nr:squamosa promoter binding protein-like 14 [Euphorbia peplus]
MEEVSAQIAPPMFIHQTLSSPFFDATSMAKKRELSYQMNNFQLHQHHRFVQNPKDNWNPKSWDWDSARFVAKPTDAAAANNTNVLQLGNPFPEQQRRNEAPRNQFKKGGGDEDDGLRLNLAGALNSVEEPVSRPNKRVRSGSPGTATYPMCQVDNCKEDLSGAKDYHRRHKVCEVHSKSSKASVGKQMQRFCQQCSRFHPLSEFDEGKRSCRRRLAGHNRRRRKTQPDDVTSRLLLPGIKDTTSTANLDLVNLLAVLARAQGKNEDTNLRSPLVPNKDQLIQILSKINSLPLPMDLASKLSSIGSLNKKSPEEQSAELLNRLRGAASSPSTTDLITVLSATLAASAPDALAFLSQRSSQSSDSEKSKLSYPDQSNGPDLQMRPIPDFPAVGGGERSSSCFRSLGEDSDCQIQESQPNLPLQLFSSSPESSSPPKLASSRKYFSSDSSNPSEGRSSPSSSPPVVHKLFPLESTAETVKSEKMSTSREVNVNAEGSRTHGSMLPLELFRVSNGGADQSSYQNFPYQAGYTSSSGSDHSPSSQNSDAQDRTGRIIFKLFDKDPSHFPGKLRSQILNWLSNSPSDMESYIRPGCVVLSVYLSMSSASWEQLEKCLLQRVDSLVQESDSDFWRSGRFLLHAGRQLASYKDGKIHLCKSWRSWSSPELISVSPVAVVGGIKTSLRLRGRNLANPGTKIHCTYMGGYTSMDVIGSTSPGARNDEVNMNNFEIHGAFGRCFIEVENGFKGNTFPVIIADATICKELRLLESELDGESKDSDIISEEQTQYSAWPRSREEVLRFLNELGWLFQRKASSMFDIPDYSLSRFRFLLIFATERDYCALVKTILDMLVEKNVDMTELSTESLEMLSEIQLVNRAVKRRCRKMVDLLIHYSVASSKSYIFLPSIAGPGGITPLHLAACTTGSDDLVDALTNDPQGIGLSCWDSVLDANQQSPYAYAAMTNNHSYNTLVARKLVDRRNGQVSVTIGNETRQPLSSSMQGRRSCAKCATVAAKYNRRIMGSQGLLQRPFIHSMLAIAAVCVCVCLFLRGAPDIGLVAPFKWENLHYGTM